MPQPPSNRAESVARFDALASPVGTAMPGDTPVPVSPSDDDVELLCGQYTEHDGGSHGCVLRFGHVGPHDLAPTGSVRDHYLVSSLAQIPSAHAHVTGLVVGSLEMYTRPTTSM